MARATRTRTLSELTWRIDDAPSDRERVRSLAQLDTPATRRESLHPGRSPEANGWGRRLGRAQHAFDRKTALRNPTLLAELGGRRTFAATELERFADCSSAWLFERIVDPKTIDAEPDAMLRGKVAHQALYAFYAAGLAEEELGVERVTAETLEPALPFLERCLDDALRGGVRLDLSRRCRPPSSAKGCGTTSPGSSRTRRDPSSRSFRGGSRSGSARSGHRRSSQRGIELGGGGGGEGLEVVRAGKIDRIDVDPYSAQRHRAGDYQVRQGESAFSARAQIDWRAAPADPALHARPARPGRRRADR